MGDSFYVVEFIKEGLVEAVPRAWLSPQKKSCKWPLRLTKSKMDRALRGDYDFEEGKWDEADIKILGAADSYSKAQHKLKKSENTSHLESSDDEKKRKRKRKRITMNEDMSSEDERNANIIKRISIPFPDSRNMSSTPKSLTKVVETDSRNMSSTPKSLTKVVETDSRNMPSTQKQLGKVDQTDFEEKVFRFLEGLKFELKEVKKKIEENSDLLRELREKEYDAGATPRKYFKFPIENTLELEELEISLVDPAVAADLISLLSRVGGSNFNQLTNNIMLKVVSKDMALKFSFHGRKSKLVFKNLKLSTVIIDAVLKRHITATEIEVARRIGTFLSNSGDRLGGRKERQKVNEEANVM